MRAPLVLGALVGVFIFSASAAAAASPHAQARALLLKCENAFSTLYVGPLEANTPQVPKANLAAQRVYNICSSTRPMLTLWGKYQHDTAIYDAYQAYLDLAFGSGDYETYCSNVAGGDTAVGILHRAEREIAQGRALASKALREL